MITVKSSHNRVFATVASVFLVVLMLMSTMVYSFAGANSNDTKAARDALVQGVSNYVGSADYALDGGGYIQGNQILDSTTGQINAGNFEKLTSAAQSEFVSDVATASNLIESNTKSTDIGQKDNSTASNTVNCALVSNSTVTNWWRELQNTKGVGTKFMMTILENTKPDFATANQIYSPFSGVLNTILALIAIVGIAILGIVMVSDIMYIALPPMRMLVDGGDGKNGGKGKASFLISSDAIYAVEQAENNNDGNKKHAIGIYFKRRVVMLIILGICMLYLVSGSIFTLVGMIMDLVSGFIGF